MFWVAMSLMIHRTLLIHGGARASHPDWRKVEAIQKDESDHLRSQQTTLKVSVEFYSVTLLSLAWGRGTRLTF